MKINFKSLSKVEKTKICSTHRKTCMSGCPLRVYFKRSAICLRDLERIANIDMKIDVDDKTILLCKNIIDMKEGD